MIGRVFDVDDILLNIVGGLLGFTIYYLFDYLGEKFNVLRTKIFINIVTLLGFLLFMIFVIGRIA